MFIQYLKYEKILTHTWQGYLNKYKLFDDNILLLLYNLLVVVIPCDHGSSCYNNYLGVSMSFFCLVV